MNEKVQNERQRLYEKLCQGDEKLFKKALEIMIKQHSFCKIGSIAATL